VEPVHPLERPIEPRPEVVDTQPVPIQPSSQRSGRVGRRRTTARWRGLTPVIATSRTMTTAACLFYGTGSAMILLLSLGAAEAGARIGLLRAVAAAGLLLGLAALPLRDAVPPWVHHPLNLLGSTIITLEVWCTGGGSLAVPVAALYVLVPVHAFAFFRRPVAVAYSLYVALLAGLLWWPLHLFEVRLVIAGGAVDVLAAGTVGWLVRSAERAELDAVTGLPNRRGFDRALEEALSDARGRGGHVPQPAPARDRRAWEPAGARPPAARPAARPARVGTAAAGTLPARSAAFTVGFLDLDHFRRLNETEGRPAGDLVLRQVGETWQAMLPPDATLAHGGSGEYLVLLPGTDAETAGRLLEEMRERLPHLGTASAGLAEWHPDDTLSLLMSRADASLYRAKRAGRNRMDPRVGMNVTVREMRDALGDGAFIVLFQPIVDLTTELLVGAEALVRWEHPSRGVLNPADFIPLAEESGAIIDIGRHVLQEACHAVAAAQRRGFRLGKITVNVSGLQLQQPGYAREVLEIVERSGWDPLRLVLEVTESSLAAEHGVSVAALEELRRGGIRIAIDDFGTGYSSLSRLAHLPVDILKIDRSFVSSIVPGRPAPIIASITALAEALGLATVAEGIEHHDQATVLARHGCDRGQGWLYGRPVPLAQLPWPASGAGEATVPVPRAAPSTLDVALD